MSKLQVRVVDMKGKEVGKVDLDPEVFAVRVDQSMVHEAVRWQRNSRRAGTHAAQTRGDMKGGGKKPWRQKGSGRARAGTRTSPVWVGGGVAHGPKPRDYSFRLSKRARRQALAAVLSEKARNEQLVVLDDLSIDSGKTKDFVAVLKNLGVREESALLVLPEKEGGVWRSSRNVKRVIALPVAGANVYDLMRQRFLICTKAGVLALQSRVKGAGEQVAE